MSSSILRRVMLAFEGLSLPARIDGRLAGAPAAGVTLFRALNVRSPGQVRELTDAIQRAGAKRAGGGDGASGPSVPLLVAADQEGGQLIALGEASTAFAGNMALGAVDDPELTERVGHAIGLEARAMGVNVVYAPCLDLATNPANPALGIRSFGDDPAAVGRHGVAFLRGLQAAGVAGTVKHAPGKGHVAADTHHGVAVIDAPRDVLDAREFVPFRAAFAAGPDVAPRLAMSGHAALPAVSGRADLPSTLSRAVMTDLLRGDLGFDGLTISDALDMRALAQGPDQAIDVIAAVRAGVDLLLASADAEALARIEAALVRAVDRQLIDPDEMAATDRRIADLRTWLGSRGPAPGIDVVGGSGHQAIAEELARRSITLVRDPGGEIAAGRGKGGALGIARDRSVAAVMPRPTDLTPADTSSFVAPGLAAALRRYHPAVDEIVCDQRPDDAAIAAIRQRVTDETVGLVVVGTIDAHRQLEQLRLIEALAASGVPTVAVAMRGPWDVAAVPASIAALATYSILPGSMDALARVLSGTADAPGRLPLSVGR